jgi:hypothetical protein
MVLEEACMICITTLKGFRNDRWKSVPTFASAPGARVKRFRAVCFVEAFSTVVC